MAPPHADDNASISSKDALAEGIPSLDQLVSYFVASKSSLSCVSHVWHANDIVAAARTSLDKIAAVHAKNSFLAQSVDKQFQVAKAVRHGLATRADRAHADFKSILLVLDEVDAGVKQILEALRNTYAEPSFRPEETSSKCLYDFVDEQGLSELRAFFRTCIDDTNDAQNLFGSAMDDFDAELEQVQATLTESSGRPLTHNESISATATQFQALESHATDMADLLQSLVSHYDLCMTALRHTEGGNEAALQTSGDLPAGVNVGGLERDLPSQPISDEERGEMLKVLRNDAVEVEDVVQEIRDHVSEMEFEQEQITTQLRMTESEHGSLKRSIQLLHVLGEHIFKYIDESSTFIEHSARSNAQIEQRMEELEGVRYFYENFLSAYDGLILEIARRKQVKAAVDKVVANAMAELNKIHAADAEEREAFALEQGAYLPSDLWPGLTTQPARYELLPGHQETNEKLPDIAKDTLQRALQRSGGSTVKEMR